VLALGPVPVTTACGSSDNSQKPRAVSSKSCQGPTSSRNVFSFGIDLSVGTGIGSRRQGPPARHLRHRRERNSVDFGDADFGAVHLVVFTTAKSRQAVRMYPRGFGEWTTLRPVGKCRLAEGTPRTVGRDPLARRNQMPLHIANRHCCIRVFRRSRDDHGTFPEGMVVRHMSVGLSRENSTVKRTNAAQVCHADLCRSVPHPSYAVPHRRHMCHSVPRSPSARLKEKLDRHDACVMIGYGRSTNQP